MLRILKNFGIEGKFSQDFKNMISAHSGGEGKRKDIKTSTSTDAADDSDERGNLKISFSL